MEGDSKLVVSWGVIRCIRSWQLYQYVCEVRDLIRELQVVLYHIPRSQNAMADKLAKWGVGLHEVFIGDHFPDS